MIYTDQSTDSFAHYNTDTLMVSIIYIILKILADILIHIF